MEQNDSLVQVKVIHVISHENVRERVFNYEDCICLGEMIRNICVNLGIDPDTEDGVTKNIEVYNLMDRNALDFPWNFNPYHDLSKYQLNGKLSLKITMNS